MAKDETGIPLADMIDRLYRRIDTLEAKLERHLASHERREPRLCNRVDCYHTQAHYEH